MIERGIRNIAIKDNEVGSIGIVNDRTILEFLFSHSGKEVMQRNGVNGLQEIAIVDNLDMINPTEVRSDTSISKEANPLLNLHNPCLVLDGRDHIATPWDIVMKTLMQDYLDRDARLDTV